MLIYLIGFMGCGKSTTAKKLSSRLGYHLMDMDYKLEEEYHVTIADMLVKYDEFAFRKLEQKILNKTFSLKNTVISTGGGTPCFEDNMEKINNHGLSLYIQVSPKMLYDRLRNSSRPRPLLQKIKPDQQLQYIEDLLIEREKYYLKAHHIIDGKDLDIEELAKLFR